MSTETADGNYVGFEPNFADYVLGDSGLGLQLVPITVNAQNWERYLSQKKVRLVVASVSADTDRRKRFIFAGPYLHTPLGLLSPHGTNPASEPRKVCYISSTTAVDYVRSHSSSRFRGYAKDAETTDSVCEDEVHDGTAVFVTDYVKLLAFTSNKSPSEAAKYDLSELTDSTYQDYYIALRNDDKKLCQKIDDEIVNGASSYRREWFDNFHDTILNGRGDTGDKSYSSYFPSPNPDYCTPRSSQAD